MKKVQFGLLCMAVLPWTDFAVGAQEAGGGVAVKASVIAVSDKPLVSSEAGTSIEARVGDFLGAGAVVTTNTTAAALLRVLPNAKQAVLSNTKMRFDGSLVSQNESSTRSDLLEGRLFCAVDDPSEDRTSSILISTKGGIVTGVRGRWLVEQQEKRTLVAAADGETEVKLGGTASGGTVKVLPGRVLWIELGEDETPQVKLVDLTTGTVQTLSLDGGVIGEQRADAVLLADCASLFTVLAGLSALENGGFLSPTLITLVQSLDNVVKGFSDGLPSGTPQNGVKAGIYDPLFALNPDNSPSSGGQSNPVLPPDLTQPVDSPNKPVVSPEAPF